MTQNMDYLGIYHHLIWKSNVSIAKKIRTGMIHINYAPVEQKAPFGGYKKSGNGREWGKYGIEDFLESKAIIGTEIYKSKYTKIINPHICS